MTAGGYSTNATWIFSWARHRQIAEAYLRGLERFAADGGAASRVHSVASFFVSRVDTKADRRLIEIGREDLKGRLGVANAKLAYQQYKELFSGPRWDALATRGQPGNAACGRRRQPRIRATATRSTSKS